MVREQPPQPPPYPAEKARGGEIILRRRWQRDGVHRRLGWNLHFAVALAITP
jgi:hypothetical protein